MGLPTCQRRILKVIEGELTNSDPRLASLFSFFARLTQSEAMPWIEQLTVRPVLDFFARLTAWSRRPAARVRALVLLPAALAAMACALTLAFGFSGGQRSAVGTANHTTRQLVVKHRFCRFTLVRAPILAC